MTYDTYWFLVRKPEGKGLLGIYKRRCEYSTKIYLQPLTPNDYYSGRTAPLTSKNAFYIFIQQNQVLNILNTVYILSFVSSKCSLFHNSNVFGSCFFTFYIQGVLKLKKK